MRTKCLKTTTCLRSQHLSPKLLNILNFTFITLSGIEGLGWGGGKITPDGKLIFIALKPIFFKIPLNPPFPKGSKLNYKWDDFSKTTRLTQGVVNYRKASAYPCVSLHQGENVSL